ncbi:MAG: hypothetical protein DMF63_13405 [Acidobacteria bacterium]|nr:MAG: hypothetical protein DMF63_13405 [Acidobacteriota bacterium]
MSSVIYEVRTVVERDLCGRYERYMTDQHIPDLMKTGCFTEASFENFDGGEYQMRYVASSREQLDRYLRDHAPRLRQDFLSHFPDGITVWRKEWNVIRHFA